MAGRGRRILGWLVGVLVGLVVLGLAAGGWYYSDQLLPAPRPSDALDDGAIQGVAGRLVRLPATGDAATDGVFGLDYANGFAQLGPIEDRDDATVTRPYEVLEGTPPQPGAAFDVTAYAYPDDPSAALGLGYEDVDVACPLGTCPAWYVPGDDDTWAIFVHGRGARRAEALRSLGVVAELGLPSLVISYRNDGVGPETGDGFGRFGATEWHDLDAAVTYALDHGAADITLIGFSQGGGLVAEWLLGSDRSDLAVAAVLDAPLVAMHDTLVLQAQARGVPDPVIPPLLFATKIVAGLRADLPFDQLEPLDHADELDVPILLFHGTADPDVPVSSSDELAAARPDLVTYLRYEGVGHVRAWNTHRQAYELALRDHLLRYAVG